MKEPEVKIKDPKFKVGEWCFFEFDLFQVKKTEDSRITSVTDGYLEHGGYDLSDRCFPLDMTAKVSSNEVESWYQSIRKEAGNSNINYPSLHERLCELWSEMCRTRNDDVRYAKCHKNLQDFGNKVVKKIKDMKYEEVDGIKILR
jgi:hypothetical protein